MSADAVSRPDPVPENYTFSRTGWREIYVALSSPRWGGADDTAVGDCRLQTAELSISRVNTREPQTTSRVSRWR